MSPGLSILHGQSIHRGDQSNRQVVGSDAKIATVVEGGAPAESTVALKGRPALNSCFKQSKGHESCHEALPSAQAFLPTE